MPILKVRQTNNEWFDVRKLTLDELDLGNGIKLSSKTNNNKLLVNGEEILNKDDYNTLNSLIQTNIGNINTIKGKLTEFYEINSSDGKLDLTDELTKNKIHAFINFNGKKPEIEYGTTTKCIIKGDNPAGLEKAGIYELDAYKYGEKFYIIWKNWEE